MSKAEEQSKAVEVPSDSMNEAGEQSKVMAPLSARCEGCGKPSRTKCSKCDHFVYCGVTCQKRIWPCHKYVCPRIEDLVVDPEVSTLFGVGDPVWEASQRKLDSEHILSLIHI